MSEAVKFEVVNSSNLPPDLRYSGIYGPVMAAIATLSRGQAIHVLPNGGGQPELTRMYAGLKYQLKRQAIEGIQVCQRGSQLWVYHTKGGE